MKTIVLTAIFTLYLGQALSQTGGFEINHIFFTVDSLTYNELLKDEFLTKVLANTREFSSTTLADSWTGKYIYGKNSFIEVFSQAKVKNNNLQLGDKFSDLAIVFKTKKSGDMDKFKGLLDSLKVSTKFETTEFVSNGQIHKGNYILFIDRPLLHDNFRPYVEEKTKELLLSRGFTENEIIQEISEEKFREKLRGRKFDKLFDKIKGIDLKLTNNEFNYLAETLKYLGFLQRGHIFSNEELVIKCQINENSRFRIDRIEISLCDKITSKEIIISNHLTLLIQEKVAQFIFNYD